MFNSSEYFEEENAAFKFMPQFVQQLLTNQLFVNNYVNRQHVFTFSVNRKIGNIF